MTEANRSVSRKSAPRTKGAARTAARRSKSIPRTAARRSTTSAAGRASRSAGTIGSRTRRSAARAGLAVHVGRTRKPTIGVREAVGRLTALLAEFPAIYGIWSEPGLDPSFREELMVAVARQNGAPYCNWMHKTLAELAGASDAELGKIEQLDPRGLDRRKWVAVTYVRALAARDFKGVPDELRQAMQALYTPHDVRNIELVAEVMDLINRMANTYDAMVSRVQRKPTKDSHVLDELVFTGVFLTVAPPIVLALSRYSERSYADTMRSLIAHVRRFHAQQVRG